VYKTGLTTSTLFYELGREHRRAVGDTARRYSQKIQPEDTARRYSQKILPEGTARRSIDFTAFLFKNRDEVTAPARPAKKPTPENILILVRCCRASRWIWKF
jgi:hypothetical protein